MITHLSPGPPYNFMVSQKIVATARKFDAAVEHFNFAGGSLGNSEVASAKICDNGTGYWLIRGS